MSDIFELRVISAFGLPYVLGDVATWQVSPVISDAGTTQFTYPRNGVNWSQVHSDLDLAFFLKGVEVGTLRSVIEQISYDEASVGEEGDVATVTCRTSMARMERAVVYPQGWPGSANPPSYTFTGATAGYILITLMNLCRLRGTLNEIGTSTFTATHDSNGNAWSNTMSISWNAQTTYLQVINDLQTYGMCDAIMNVHELKLYNYQTLGVDHTTAAAPPIMRKGRDLTQSSFQGSTRGLITVSLTSGANNLYVEAVDTEAEAVYGRREGGTSASGVSDPTQLTQLGLQYATALGSEIDARTNALIFGDPGSPMPGQDFDLGDWMWTDIDGTLHRQRVLQWSLASDTAGVVTGTTAMDTIFGEFLTRLQAQVNNIENGSTITGPSTPTPVAKITSPPQVPTGLSVGSLAYVDNQGHTFASVTASWVAVTEDQTSAADPNIGGYQVQIKYHISSNWSFFATDAGTLNLYCGGLLPNTLLDVRVQCVDTQGNVSGWSATDTITTAADVVAPNQPSTPVVSSTLGQLSIVWDGKDSGGSPMPGDFDHLVVYVDPSSPTFTPSSANQFATMRAGGTITVPGAVLTYGTTYYSRLVAFDQTGNASAASVAGSATLTQVVSTDILTGQVSISNLAFSDVGNLVDNGSFEDANWRATRNTAFGGTHWSFDNTTSSAGAWSALHTGTGGQTTESVILNTVNCTVGQTFMGAADWKISTAVTSAMRVAVGVNFFDVNSVNVGYSDLSYCWTAPCTNNNDWTPRIATNAVVTPATAVKAQIVFATSGHTAGQVWADNVEVRMQMDNLIIANAAITDAKVANMSANKIIAGTISAGVILSGSIGTAASGQRVVMDGTGLHAYDSSGNLIFDVNDFNPIVTIAASSGVAKIQLDTSLLYPTLKFFDTSNSNYAFFNAVNNDGNSACIAMQGGNYTSGALTLANQFTASGAGFGAQLKVIDTANQNTQGGQVQATPSGVNMNYQTEGTVDGGVFTLSHTGALFGLFPTAATHGAQFIYGYNSGAGDCSIEIDGYFPNNVSAATAQALWVASVPVGSGFGGISFGYGPTMFSAPIPIVVYSCGTTSSIPSSTVSVASTTGSALSLSAGAPAAWSALCWAVRAR